MPSRLSQAIDQLRIARAYTIETLERTDRDRWFELPAAGVSHIAWQVGHLAMADYRLLIERVRGHVDDDEQLISAAFLKTFGKGSIPSPEVSAYPPRDEIEATFDRVREAALAIVGDLRDSDLDQPPCTPHRLFNDKFGALTWCCRHEMLHAGQIGLLHRQLGGDFLW